MIPNPNTGSINEKMRKLEQSVPSRYKYSLGDCKSFDQFREKLSKIFMSALGSTPDMSSKVISILCHGKIVPQIADHRIVRSSLVSNKYGSFSRSYVNGI